MNTPAYKLKRDKKVWEENLHTCILVPRLPQAMQKTKVAGRPDFDYSHPDDWPEWLQNAHTEGAGVEILPDGSVLWIHGTFHDGIWMGGYWMGGCWRDGIWLGGQWQDGRWYHGEWRDGDFHGGIWEDGVFRGGYFGGWWKGGMWIDGAFNGYWERTRTAPCMMPVPEEEKQRSVAPVQIRVNKEVST